MSTKKTIVRNSRVYRPYIGFSNAIKLVKANRDTQYQAMRFLTSIGCCITLHANAYYCSCCHCQSQILNVSCPNGKVFQIQTHCSGLTFVGPGTNTN